MAQPQGKLNKKNVISIAASVVLLITAFVHGDVIQTFQCEELFGANHAEQIVYFDLDKPVDANRVTLLDGDGNAQPFQIMSDGRIALRSDLPAWQSRQWTLETASSPPSHQTDLAITESPDWVQIINQHTGVRIAKPSEDPHQTPCPIQGIRLRDGTWTATEFNAMSRPARAMAFEWLSRGPLVVRARVTYRYDRAELRSANEPQVIPAGEGEYSCTIELQSGQPVIGLEEYSEVDVRWSVNIEHGLHPNYAQYNGHRATSVEAGRIGDGLLYKFPESRGKDALVDLDYTTGRTDSYSLARFPLMSNWDIWAVNTGYYWQVYSDKPQHKNMLGIFHGKPSKLGKTGVSGVAIDTQPDGVRDLDSAVGADGVIHMVYEHGRTLRYVALDASLTPGKTVDLGDNLAHASLAVNSAGEPIILASDISGSLLLLHRSNGTFTHEPLRLDPALQITNIAKYAWHTFAGDRHYLFLYGDLTGVHKGLLLARDTTDDAFRLIHEVAVPPDSRQLKSAGYESQRAKPAMVASPEGDLHLMFTAGNNAPTMLRIPSGSDQVATKAHLLGAHSGMGFNLRTAHWFMADFNGELFVGGPDESRATQSTGLTQRPDPGRRGPNRRSMASSPNGQTAVMVHSVRAGSHYPAYRDLSSYTFRRDDDKWGRYEQADALQLAWARVHYHQPTEQYLLLGRNNQGRLAVYTCGSDAGTPQRVHEFAESEKRYTGLHVRFKRAMPTQYYAQTIRFSWAIFTGYTAEEVKPLDEVQGIGLQYNKHSGVNITSLTNITGRFADPPQGFGNMYVSDKAWQQTAEQLRAELAEGNSTLYKELVGEGHPSDIPIFNFWREPTREHALKIYEEVDELAREYVVNLVNGYGVYRQTSAHFMGARRMSDAIIRIDQLIASGLLNSEQTHRLKVIAELYAACLWDNDVLPMQAYTNVNRGTANMSSMWFNTRHVYTLMLASHPYYAERAALVGDEAIAQLHDYVNEAGSSNASTHYTSPALIPILNLMQQLQMAGIQDHFASSERLRRFAEFYMQQVTPREVRFDGERKVIGVGDGSTEYSTLHGQLGTGFAQAHPELSKRLMWVWNAMGKPRNSFFGPSILKTDASLPTQTPKLGSAHFDGWCSVLRYGFETENESAIWLIGGDHYSDHRHDDNGSVVMYALGAPISIDWGSFGYPRVEGQMMHSMVTPESLLNQPWDADNTPLNHPYAGSRSYWRSDGYEHFYAFTTATTATSRFVHNDADQLRRTVRLIHIDREYPVILIEDGLSRKPDASLAPMIFTLNLMAHGAVDTPRGDIEPEERLYGWRKEDQRQLPSSTPGQSLAAELHRFGFQGQWGVDFDVYVDASSPQQFALGNWGHTWHPTSEVNDYYRAHCKPFTERQHILRLRGEDGFRVMLLPYREGGNRPAVHRDGDKLIVSFEEQKLVLGRDTCIVRSENELVLISFAGGEVAADGVVLDAGPGEVVLRGREGHARLVMNKASRKLSLPSGWAISRTETDGVTCKKAGADSWIVHGRVGDTVRLLLMNSASH